MEPMGLDCITAKTKPTKQTQPPLYKNRYTLHRNSCSIKISLFFTLNMILFHLLKRTTREKKQFSGEITVKPQILTVPSIF